MHKALLFVYFLPCILSAQEDEYRRITKTLCSEEFHGRGYVNGGDSIAAAFIADEFRKLGVEPLRETYFQYFDFSVNTFPGRMSVTHNGNNLKPGIHFLADPATGYYKGELKPYSIKAEDLMDEKRLSAVLSKVMKDAERNSLLLDLAGVGSDTLKELAGIEQALSKLMPVIRVHDSKFNWSVAGGQLKHPVIHIQDSVYQHEGEFELTIDARFIRDHRSQNVIAHIPAKKKCRKTVVFTAHYDHLGRMGMSTYFPGANDNASGTAMLLSMARYFKQNPSRYNILFIAFGGEEAGLLGSKYYTENPQQKLKKIKFLINLDIMGSGEEGITVVNATLFDEQFRLLQEINAADSLLTNIKSRGPAANSDHHWFTEKGVPAFFVYTMGPNKHYHDVFDTYDELTFIEYEDIIRLLTTFVEEL